MSLRTHHTPLHPPPSLPAAVLNFTCPTAGYDARVDVHPRFADPEDCQYFYVCINGKEPRRNGCQFGQVFSTEIKACVSAKEVPEW